MKKRKGIIIGIVGLSLVTMVSLIDIGNSNQDRKISISLSEQEWNVVITALQEMPMKVAAPVYSSIMQQAQEQLRSQSLLQKPQSLNKDTVTNKKKP